MAGVRYRRQMRLVNARDFACVFRNSQKSSDELLTVLARANGLDIGRLGMAIARKHMHTAVARNRAKRLVRESFRLHHDVLSGLDIVVLGRAKLHGEHPRRVTESLERHWKRICLRCKKL